jgi:hypothetical protein
MPGYDRWMTPPDEISIAREYMGGNISLDPASEKIAQQYIYADTYYGLDRGVNGLVHDWYGNVWCNPPYSAGNIDAFVDKAIREWHRLAVLSPDGWAVDNMLILVNSSTDTRWYHDLLRYSTAALLYTGRIKYWKIFDGSAHEKWEGEVSKAKGLNKVGNSPRYLNTLFMFNRTGDVSRFKEYYGNKGTIVVKA